MKLLPKETYFAMLENSVGSHLFRNVYAEIDGEKKDILANGNFSCSFFVSSILSHFNFQLIKETHTGIKGLLADMKACGWVESDRRIPGAVVVWDQEITQPTLQTHDHVGFILDEHTAISNYDRDILAPQKHHIHFEGDPNGKAWRGIDKIFTHPFLES